MVFSSVTACCFSHVLRYLYLYDIVCDKSPLHSRLLQQRFDPVIVSGFSFDVERQQHSVILRQDMQSDSQSDPQSDPQSENQDTKKTNDKRQNTIELSHLGESFNCSLIQVVDPASISASQLFDLNQASDLKHLRNQLQALSQENKAYKLCFQDNPEHSEEYILRKKWFKFCGSAVWLDLYKVYFMVNRIVYAKDGRRNNPTISILSGQVFDKNWREIKGFKFPHSDLVFPTILPHDLDLGQRENKLVIGSEDPRVILNEYQNPEGIRFQEPVIIFNARRAKVKWARAMHVYRPFNDPREVILLAIKDKKRSFIEKNWAPFMDNPDANNDHNMINFVYNFNPLRVVKCSLQTGDCVKVSGPRFNTIDANDNAGVLRGGTNIIQIPQKYIPLTEVTEGRKFWLGIARSHNKECGCMRELYRPHIFIMTRSLTKEDSFELIYVSSMVDFNINPEPWSKSHSNKGTCVDGKSVLIPNSIAYWDVDPRSDTDYMGLTFSEADRTNKLVHLKGVLQHIHKVLHDSARKRIQDTDKENDSVEQSIDHKLEEIELGNKFLGLCSTYLAEEYCQAAENVFGW
ncbi:hypothetical protein CANMA_001186 [Candida margitis]|uniref:uncharacterized protein n=1 Tax=Candida margitis TaxID=1775924 RepID=UPI0022277B8E|nr:uncharacterized protein CANMA_001186 [Candida margitis]KAI5969724.1 hypothetical protein CANMA_001186 [Candida margitis]